MSYMSSSLPEDDFLPREDVEDEDTADLLRPAFEAEPVLLRVLAIDDLLLDVEDEPVSVFSIESLSSLSEEVLLAEVPLVFP